MIGRIRRLDPAYIDISLKGKTDYEIEYLLNYIESDTTDSARTHVRAASDKPERN